jgi:hypothetical protein
MSNMQELEDRLAIRDLIERYTVSVTRRDWDQMGRCFHLESRWQVAPPFNLDFSTRKGIQDGISGQVNRSDFLVQMTHGVVIDDYTPERARATVVLNEIGRTTSTKTGLFLLGVYHDVITRIDGAWGFESRLFQPYYVNQAWPEGMVAVDYATRP